MDDEIREAFRELRKQNEGLRLEVKHDIGGISKKIDGHIETIEARCAERGSELAVLKNRDKERDRRVDVRIGIGLVIIAAVSLALKFAI